MGKIEKIVLLMFFASTIPLFVAVFFVAGKVIPHNKQAKPLASVSVAVSAKASDIQIIQGKTKPEKLPNPPQMIKAIYITSWSASSKKYLNNYLFEDIFKNTQINAVVIDIKDYSGYVSYNSQAPEVIKYKTSKNIISDLPDLIQKLHEKNIYTIARISTFEDPAYAVARPELAIHDKSGSLWKDNNGLYWLDPSSTEAQDYNISIAKDALDNGFDEVNFDYIRFPSDGKTKNMELPFYDGTTPRHEVIKNFFARIRKELPTAVISADLFGQTTVNKDDLGIGQIIEDSFEYFDYVSPMIYPSHYADNFMGYKNPAEYPAEIVGYSLDTALLRLQNYEKIFKPQKFAKIRPWLQDFNMGAIYTTDMVESQINATQKSLGENYAGYLMWNPSNIYKTKALK